MRGTGKTVKGMAETGKGRMSAKASSGGTKKVASGVSAHKTTGLRTATKKTTTGKSGTRSSG